MRDTESPMSYWELDWRAKSIPSLSNTYRVNPEQSKPSSVVPPLLYVVPIAESMTLSILESANALPAPSDNANVRLSTAAVNFFLNK